MGLQVLISIFIENVLMFVVKKIHLTIRNAVDQERNMKYSLRILKKHLLESEVEEYEIQIFNRTVCFFHFFHFLNLLLLSGKKEQKNCEAVGNLK